MIRSGKSGSEDGNGKSGARFQQTGESRFETDHSQRVCVSDGAGAKTHLLVCQTHPVKRENEMLPSHEGY